jgi:site-specific DNA recombinase
MPTKPAQPRLAPPNTYVIYCRVSTDGQERDGTSLETQEAACRQYVAAQGGTVVAVQKDTRSGATLERPGLDRVRALVEAGEAAVLLSYAVDRLSRDQDHVGVIYDGVRRAGARLEFVTEKFEDTPVGRFLLGSFAFVAQMERLNIADRLLRGKRARLQRGQLWGGSMDLYGYRRAPERERRHAYEPEAAVVREIYRLCVEECMPTRAIAKLLNDQGVPSPAVGKRRGYEGARWTRGAVFRILTNEAYAGRTWGWRWMTDVQGRTQLRPETEWVLLPDSVSEAIVPPAYWQQAQDQLAVNNRNASRNARRAYLLKGLVYCRCGRKRYGGASWRYYCSARDFWDGKCDAPSVSATVLEAAVWCAVDACLRDPAVIQAAVQQAAEAAAAEQATAPSLEEVEALRRALRDLEAKIDRAVEGFIATEGIAREAFQRQQDQLARQHRRLAARLAELEEHAANARANEAALVVLPDWCSLWVENLNALDVQGKRRALLALNVRVTVLTSERFRIEAGIPVPAAAGTASIALQPSARSRHNSSPYIPFAVTADRWGRLVA